MKTIREWLETIPDEDVREKAIRITKPNILLEEMASFDRAISGAFIWGLTDDGHLYWENIANKYKH